MKKMLLIILLFCNAICWSQDAFAKADSLFNIQKFEEAKPLYKSLLLQNKKDPILLRRLGDIEAHATKYKNAFNYYKQLLDLDKSNANYHYLYGGALGLYAKEAPKLDALGYLDNIKYHLKQAAILDSKHIDSRWALVQLYCELPAIIGGSYKKSRKYADELREISPVDGHLAHGFIEEHDKEYRNAEIHYKKAIEVGGSLTTYRKLASLYEKKTEEYLKAIITLQKAYEVHQQASLLEEISKLKRDHDLAGK